MPAYNYNLNTVAQDNNQSTPVSTRERVPVRVVDIILDDTHPEYENSNDIGVIKYRAINRDYDEERKEDLPKAYPLNTTYRVYPVKNEIVLIESAPGPDHQKESKTYYSQIVGIWDNPHHNAFPDLNIYDGELDLGEDFIENGNIRPRTPRAGDVLIEGRRGQSIRFTGNGNGTLITNGQIITGSAVPTIPESINGDPASLYMVTGRVPLSAASTDYSSYTSYVPSSPETYTGNQVVLNSGRLVFNSKTDHILLSSNLTIGFNAIKGFNFDTPQNFVVSTGTSIRLGSATADHPVLKGDDTVEVLTELLDTLLSLMEGLVQGASQPAGPMPTVIEQGSATTYVLANLKTRLEGLKSTKTYTE
jgi:hypothetical protein